MNLARLHSLMIDGAPVYHIQQGHVYASSIAGIEVERYGTFLRLDDGTLINTKNFGRVAFWIECEARKAVMNER